LAAARRGPGVSVTIGRGGSPDTTTLNDGDSAPAGNFTVALNHGGDCSAGCDRDVCARSRARRFCGRGEFTDRSAQRAHGHIRFHHAGTGTRSVALRLRPRAHTLTVHANATGLAEQTATLAVTVTQAQTGGSDAAFLEDIPPHPAAQAARAHGWW
jgi:hypothetical protein